jgi:hypothetical protein
MGLSLRDTSTVAGYWGGGVGQQNQIRSRPEARTTISDMGRGCVGRTAAWMLARFRGVSRRGRVRGANTRIAGVRANQRLRHILRRAGLAHTRNGVAHLPGIQYSGLRPWRPAGSD